MIIKIYKKEKLPMDVYDYLITSTAYFRGIIGEPMKQVKRLNTFRLIEVIN